ncbi:hypothetical protein SAMN04488128_1011636 [Chitinophaga eiseniae]|uniref:DUF1440 domain-containing protein n=1 Tax=Chitinophaga eiseniae TaxID=634771 RepID=A0A1T4NKW5_9BACT|nr:hypothetical protein [Chitinophaga eiseniae]SJZ79803.1 hypothetical protein SAMN04488128_1011636 [Chitinophaga eiseniae]
MANTRAFPVGIIFLTWLIAGTLDLFSACLQFVLVTGKSFVNVLLFVASGVFGREAFSGNPAMVWWGVLFHYTVSLGFTLLFFFLYPRIPEMRKIPSVSGLVYGIFVWLVMNLLILPLTNIPKGPFHLVNVLVGMCILMVAIGLPMGLMAGKYYQYNKSAS